MNMDNTIETTQRMGLAKMLYQALRGVYPDQETLDLSAKYASKLFTTPWRDRADPNTQAYTDRFFEALQTMGNSTDIVARWQDRFGQDDFPGSPELAREFLTEFFRIHLHLPRDHHNFLCQQRDVTQDGVMDFAIEHPISVEFWAIYLTRSGSATLEVGGESTRLGPNSVVVIAPGCSCTLTRSSSAEHWVYDFLCFRSRMDWIELLEWATSLNRPVAFTITDQQDFHWLCHETARLGSTTYRPDTLSERLCNNIIENILLSIRIFSEDVTGIGARTNRKVQGAVDFILNHYGDEISLEEVANHVNSSSVRLNTLFREHFGISVIKWRDQIRMQKAKELIIHSQDSIKNIAHRVGYADPLYFSRRFKEHFRVAPSAFRQ